VTKLIPDRNQAETSPLAGQVAVITGAGRGIGRAIALRLAELGAHTFLCGRSRPALEKTAAAIQNTGGAKAGGTNAGERNSAKTTIVECDVTELTSVEALARQVDRAFQRLDILVNNAGIAGPGGPLHQLPPADWDRIFNTNLRGVYYCIRSLAPLMIKSPMIKSPMIKSKAPSGHIINISSLAGKNALANGAAYAASKWGLNGLTYSVAEELRAHNIRVSVICPGSVHTDFSEHAGKNAEKMLQASDVAHAVAMIVTQAPQSFASEILLRPTQKP
jgi:NAD(P)-dependent dehydrogenase (short-subunit alcohol dehydrogenase family)